MHSVFENMPGLDVPVGKVIATLADIWEVNREAAAGAPSAFRASQMNLVLHFGLGVTPEEARGRFDVAVRFAQRYPCRILVLCPVAETSEIQVRAKVFAECYVGRSRQEMACCEAIILSYAKESRGFLENQVSILVESDLPTYYWPNHFSEGRKIHDYLFFVNVAQRVVVDSSVDGDDVLALGWPRAEVVRDLVHARLLPVRQVLGQFLAGFPPAALATGLRRVTVTCCGERAPEGRVLSRWIRGRLEACAATAAGLAVPKEFAVNVVESGGCERLAVHLDYEGEGAITWTADLAAKRAEARAAFHGGSLELTTSVSLLGPEAALAEAMFF
jgi:hypothetical protein